MFVVYALTREFSPHGHTHTASILYEMIGVERNEFKIANTFLMRSTPPPPLQRCEDMYV